MRTISFPYDDTNLVISNWVRTHSVLRGFVAYFEIAFDMGPGRIEKVRYRLEVGDSASDYLNVEPFVSDFETRVWIDKKTPSYLRDTTRLITVQLAFSLNGEGEILGQLGINLLTTAAPVGAVFELGQVEDPSLVRVYPMEYIEPNGTRGFYNTRVEKFRRGSATFDFDPQPKAAVSVIPIKPTIGWPSDAESRPNPWSSVLYPDEDATVAFLFGSRIDTPFSILIEGDINR